MEPAPAADRRRRMRRIVLTLVVVDTIVLVVALVIWLALRGDGGGSDEANAVNEGLRGSRPPAGQTLPDLAHVGGITPPLPDPEDLRGSATAIVATCIDCRSGDVIGGFLGRLEDDDLPEGARMHVVAWDGDVDAWRTRWGIDERIVLHAATNDASRAAMRRQFGIAPVAGAEESGIAFLYDAQGRWRSTFFLGQLDREDLRHDLAALDD